ncbi:MAG: DUF4136 domain-containing protein [Cyclobacteriaceae bacterium]|nr:DUF4136 domain-containing protein [Cyclobacteriaceae bacterium]
MRIHPIVGSVFLFLIVLLSACSSGIHTSSWRAKGVDLKVYKSYAWVVPGDTTLGHRRDDKLYGGSIQYLADTELKAKGMTVDTHSPDAVFMFDTRLEDHVRYSQSPSVSVGFGVAGPAYYGGPGYYVGGSVPVAGGEVTTSYYKQGTLVIEMYDLKTKKILWRGWANKELDYSTDMDYTLRKAIHDIFVYLPIKHKPGS